jgi:hypothetical protein
MRTARTNHFRIVMGAGLLLVLVGSPLLLGLTRPPSGGEAEVPGLVGVYASGLGSLGVAGLVALPLAVFFSLWLMAGERRQVNRKYLAQGARNRVNALQSLRTLAIIIGAAGLIVGSLAGLYAAMIAIRPDLYLELPIPFFTFGLAFPSFLGGLVLYVLGRLGR